MITRIAISQILFFSTLLTACGEDGVIVVGDGSPVNADVETLSEQALDGVAGLPDFRMMTSGLDSISEIDLFEPERELGAGAGIRSAVDWSDERVLLLTGDSLLVWDGTLRPSPMAEIITAPDIIAMAVREDELWFTRESGLSVWRDGWLNDLAIDGQTAQGALAAGALEDGTEVVWVATDSGVLAFTGSAGAWTAVVNHPLPAAPEALAVDGNDALFAVAGGDVHRRTRDGFWTLIEFPGTAVQVAGSRASQRVWVATDSGVYSGVGDSFKAVSGPVASSTHWHVDDVGRLVTLDGTSLTRSAIERPLALRGLPTNDQLFATSDLFIAPTASDQVESVSATLGGVALTVEPMDNVWRAVMEPADLEAGSYDLSVEVAYGGASTSAVRNLFVSNPTWENDIEPMFQERCSACHGGTTGTVSLITPEAWEENFDEIVSRVDRNNMPLGLEPLSDVQKGMIRGWGSKGFPR